MKQIVCLTLFLLLATCAPAAPTSALEPVVPPELSVAEYPLTQPPEAESDVLNFDSSVQGDPHALHEAERAQQFPDTSCTVDGSSGFCITLGSDQLFAAEDWTDPADGYVAVTRNGEQGIGYTNVYPIERLLRDTRLIMIWAGTNEVMSLIIEHEYYRELLGSRTAVRDVEEDAVEADRSEEKVYE